MLESDKQRLLEQLKLHEGSRRNAAGDHVAYHCPAGRLTIGYGHNLDANPVPLLGEGSVINEDQACRLLEADLSDVIRRVAKALPWAASLDGPRLAVLCNMAFNLGVPGLLGFKNTLAAVKSGKYANAAQSMLESRWAAQVGRRAIELAEQMRTGAWR